jgi:hypothetical protein
MADLTDNIADEPVIKKARGVGNKTIVLYDAATKKRRSVYVSRKDFDDVAAMEAYIRKLRDEAIAKNKQHNIDLRRQHIQSVMTRPTDVPVDIITSVADVVTKIQHTSKIPMVLDEGTGNTILILGSSKRGKSTLMMRLYDKYFKDSHKINTLFSANPHLKVYKGDPKLLVSYGFGEDHARYIQSQQYINVKTKNHYAFTNLFDDIITEKTSPILNQLVLTYRNANISMVICLQYLYLFSKMNRSNVNHTFIFGMNSYEDIENICKNMLRSYFIRDYHIAKLQDQIALFTILTKNHGFIYLDNINGVMSIHRLDL